MKNNAEKLGRNYFLITGDKVKRQLPPTKSAEKYYCAHIGTSMNPTLTKLDMLEIAPYDTKEPKVGDVVFLKPPMEDNYFVHRIVSAGPKGFLTRGDNNTETDPWVLSENKICGRIIAAHQGDKRRKIAGGFIGRLTGLSCVVRRKTYRLAVKLLRPVYRSFCTGGLLHWLIPVRLTPQVATFQSDVNASHKLLLGRRIIGSYDESLLQWQIRRPYRLFVDEASLPKPR